MILAVRSVLTAIDVLAVLAMVLSVKNTNDKSVVYVVSGYIALVTVALWL